MSIDPNHSPGQVNGKPRPGRLRKLSEDAGSETAEVTEDHGSVIEYSEQPDVATYRGLEMPVLQPYDPDLLDARSRGRIAILFTVFFGVIIILGAVLLVVDSMLGKNPAALIDYLKYTINLMETVVLLAVGYFFGARRASKKPKH